MQFKYISMEDALKKYVEQTSDTLSNKSDDKLTWNTLDSNKINTFTNNFEKYIINESDERVKDNQTRKLYLELLKYKEVKACIKKYFIFRRSS